MSDDMSSKGKKGKKGRKGKELSEEPRANSDEDDGKSTTSDPNTAENNTEQKTEDSGSDNGIVQNPETSQENPTTNNGIAPSEQCNTQNNRELLVEIKKMHSLICGQNGSQTEDGISLVQDSKRVFLKMLDKIKECVELPDGFTRDAEKQHTVNEKSAPISDESAAKTTRLETLLCYLDQKRGELTTLREKEEKIQSELNKFEHVHALRTSWYQSLQEDIQKQQQPTMDIPEVLSEEEKQVFNMLKSEVERKAEKVTQLENDIKDLQKTKDAEVNDLEKQIENQHRSGNRKLKLKEMEKEMETLRQRKDAKINDLEKQMEDQHRSEKQQLKAMEQEMETLRQRLSKVTGAKLTAGNPSFTDLNDPNRPLKLAERYRELNDNEWTNAFEILTEKGIEPNDAIKLLRDIVTCCYKESIKLADEQWKKLTRILTRTRIENADETLTEIGFGQTEFKDLKSLRKAAATKASDGVVEKVKKVILESLGDVQMLQLLNPFIEESIRLTWNMAVQDPPVHMFWDLKQGDPPNDMFKVYTQADKKNKVCRLAFPPSTQRRSIAIKRCLPTLRITKTPLCCLQNQMCFPKRTSLFGSLYLRAEYDN